MMMHQGAICASGPPGNSCRPHAPPAAVMHAGLLHTPAVTPAAIIQCHTSSSGSQCASRFTAGVVTLHHRRGNALVARFREDSSHHTSPEPPEPEEGSDTNNPAASEAECCGQLPHDAAALSRHAPVMFELGKHCPFGHTFGIVGDVPELGSWDIEQAVKLEWTEGDVWRSSVLLPVDHPVSFKYVELKVDDGSLVGWGQDIASGGNMTVTVQRSDELISGFKVELTPEMATETDIATDAAQPSSSIQPYLTARLDVAAVLPLSASYFSDTRLAVAAGLPPAVAEDMVTDRALLEQGLLNEQVLQDKWSPQHLAALAEKQGRGGIAGSEIGGPVEVSAGVGLAAGYADAGSVVAAVDRGLVEQAAAAGQQADEVMAAGSPTSGSDSSSSSSSSSRHMMTSLDFNDLTPAEQSLDEAAVSPPAALAASAEPSLAAVVTDTASHIIASSHNNDSASNVDSADMAATAAGSATKDRATKDSSSNTTSSSQCNPPPAGTKIVSAHVSASTIDVDSTPLLNPSRPVLEVEGGWDVVDPIRVREPLNLTRGGQEALPAGDRADTTAAAPGVTAGATADAAASRKQPVVRITSDGGLSVKVRGEDPLSLPDVPEVAAVRGAQAEQGFGDEQVEPEEGLLVPPEVLEPATAASSDAAPSSDRSRGSSAAAAGGGGGGGGGATVEVSGGFDREALAAETGFQGIAASGPAEAVTPAGRDVESRGFGSHEALLAGPGQAAAAGLPAQGEGMTNPDHQSSSMSRDEEQLAAALAAAAAAAGAVHYAAGSTAAEMQEAMAAVDERNALLQGPDAVPVAQVMAEAAVIGDAASPAEVAGVQEVAEVLREAARECKMMSQHEDNQHEDHGEQDDISRDDERGDAAATAPGSSSSSSSKSVGSSRWWQRWLGMRAGGGSGRA